MTEKEIIANQIQTHGSSAIKFNCDPSQFLNFGNGFVYKICVSLHTVVHLKCLFSDNERSNIMNKYGLTKIHFRKLTK